ncbi:MAG: hypothetical protein K6T34_05990 [Thermoflavifilum sp.]|nr:hypothetical protein [Thermoflavifilum sp.]
MHIHKEPTNLGLSADELLLVSNSEWILMKNHILEKAIDLMAQLQAILQENLQHARIPDVWRHTGAKISRGEKYQGLPYVILDFPRYFSQSDTFACRSLFWWGHYFTCTLHVSGKFLHQYRFQLEQHFYTLQQSDWWISCSDAEWTHQLHDRSHYQPLTALSLETYKQLLLKRHFVKLAKSYPLEKWEQFIPFAKDQYLQIFNCLGIISV